MGKFGPQHDDDASPHCGDFERSRPLANLLDIFIGRRRVAPALLAMASLGLASMVSLFADVDDAPPILLPPFDVRVDRPLAPRKEWMHTRVAGFEVITDIEASRIRPMLHDLSVYSVAIRLLWPALDVRFSRQPILVLCSEREFLDLFAIEAANRRALTMRGFHKDVSCLIVNAEVRSITYEGNSPQSDAMKDYSLRVETSQVLRAAVVDFLISRMSGRLPPWLATGLAEVLADIHISETEISIGRPSPSPHKSAELAAWEEMRRQLGPGAGGGFGAPAWLEIPPNAYHQDDDGFSRQLSQSLLPMRTLLSQEGVPSESPDRYIWRKQCHAFVHWGLFGDLGKNKARFIAFAKHAASQPITEQDFVSLLGTNYNSFLTSLRSHVESTRARVIGIRLAPGEKFDWQSDFSIATATDSEIGLLLGESALAVGNAKVADNVFHDSFRRGARDSDFLAAFGLAALDSANTAKGTRLLESAVTGKTRRARAYYELSRSLALSARSATEAPPIERATQILLSGIRNAAPAPELYVLLAQLSLATNQEPSPLISQALSEGETRFPGNRRLNEAIIRLRKKQINE